MTLDVNRRGVTLNKTSLSKFGGYSDAHLHQYGGLISKRLCFLKFFAMGWILDSNVVILDLCLPLLIKL